MTRARQLTIRITMLPKDTNAMGTVFGGVLLSQLDLAAYVAAREYAPMKFVTRAMTGIEFKAPVDVGDVVSFYTTLVRKGNTSVTIRVEVEAERLDATKQVVNVTSADVVYVSVDEEGRPVPIEPRHDPLDLPVGE